jgi:hypothetical protein
MVAALARAGVDIRPEAMGVTWEDADAAMRTLGTFVREAGLWHSIADERPVDDAIVDRGPRRGDRGVRPWQATSMKVGITLPQGCDREYVGSTREPRGPDGRRRATGRRAGVRLALAV